MTEDEAKDWTVEHFGTDVAAQLAALVDLVVKANERQNLISPSTIEHIWVRHIVDSLQLLALAIPGRWLDIGSGAGFPGLVIAIADRARHVVLVEPRRLRVEHLDNCIDRLGLANAQVVHGRVETQHQRFAVISARAVASLDKIFGVAASSAGLSTVWLMPKGRSAEVELAEVRRKWHGVFHVEQSLTSPDASIVVAREVRAR